MTSEAGGLKGDHDQKGLVTWPCQGRCERSCELARESGSASALVDFVRDSLGLYRACGFEARETAQTPWDEEIAICERALQGADTRDFTAKSLPPVAVKSLAIKDYSK